VATYPAVTPGHGVGLDSTDTQAWVDCINDLNSRIITAGELGYAEITAGSASFTAIADVTGLSITVVLGSTKTVVVTVYALVQSSIANDRIQLTLADGAGTQLQVTGDLFIPAATVTVPVMMGYRKSLTAGTYTFKVRANRQAGTGTCIVNAAAARPCYIQAIDVT